MTRVNHLALMTLTGSLCLGALPAHSSEMDYQSIADKIVNSALKIQPGETVIITGTPAEIPLLEALSVATSKSGGQPTVELNLPNAYKQAVMETPIDYLQTPQKYSVLQINNVDAFIYTGSVADPNLFSDVPEEKVAAIRQASVEATKAAAKAGFRSVSLGQSGGIPTEQYASSVGADYQQMINNFWSAVNVDYDELSASAAQLATKMEPGTTITINSSIGTELSLTLADNAEPRVNTGLTDATRAGSGPAQVWLPAGEVYACANPTSANGTVVIPSLKFRGKTIENLKLTFEDGKMVDYSAETNQKLLDDYFSAAKGDYNVLALVDFGLNPNSKPLAGSDYLSWEMGGVVSLSMGENSWAGCSVESDAGLSFQLADTTVQMGDNTIVDSGTLAGN